MVGAGIVVNAFNEDFIAGDGIKEFGVFDDEWIQSLDGFGSEGETEQGQERRHKL